MSREGGLLVVGYFGWGNFGDDAMLWGFTETVGGLDQDIEMEVVAGSGLVEGFGEEIVARWTPPRLMPVVKALVRCQSVVLAGGTHIHDFKGNPKFAWVMTRVLLLLVLASVLGCRSRLVGVGVGPLETWWGRALARMILVMADEIIVRDGASKRVVEKVSSRSVRVAPDLAVVCSPGVQQRFKSSGSGIFELGVSLSPVHSLYTRSGKTDRAMVRKVSVALNIWLRKDTDRSVRVMAVKGRGESGDNDYEVSQQLLQDLGHFERVQLVEYTGDPEEFLNQMRTCDAAAVTRYHAAVASFICELPTVLFSYHPKCRSLAEELCLPTCACLDVYSLDVRSLVIALDGLVMAPQKYRWSARPGDLARQVQGAIREVFGDDRRE